MTRWRLVAGYALRTHLGPAVALASVLLWASVIVRFGEAWRGDLVWAAGGLSIPGTLVGILVMGAVAMDTAHSRHPGRQQMTVFGDWVDRPSRFAVAACLVPTLGGVGLLAIPTLLWVGIGASASEEWMFAVLQMARVTGYLALSAALGSLLGRMANPLMAAVGSMVIGGSIAFFVPQSTTGGTRITDLGPSTTPMLGWAPSISFLLWQLSICAVLAVAAIVVPTPLSSTGPLFSLPSGVVLIAVVGCLTWPLPGPQEGPYTRRDAPPTSCGQGSPQVCLFPQHEPFRIHVEGSMQRIRAGAERSGWTDLLPQRVVEVADEIGPQPSLQQWTFLLDPAAGPAPFAPEALAWSLVNVSHCESARSDTPPTGLLEAMSELSEAWVTIAAGGTPTISKSEATRLQEIVRECAN